jgi:hypothetical protein
MSEKMTSQNELTEFKLVPYNKPLTQMIAYWYRWISLKRRSHTNFNSYVAGTESERKDLHLELSTLFEFALAHATW